jgi:hypothetical protein
MAKTRHAPLVTQPEMGMKEKDWVVKTRDGKGKRRTEIEKIRIGREETGITRNRKITTGITKTKDKKEREGYGKQMGLEKRGLGYKEQEMGKEK